MSQQPRMCGKCLFWEYGKCHRLPPIAVERGYHNITDFKWPETSEGDWCGEFRSIR